MKLKHILWTGLLALILFGVIVALGLKFNWGGDIKPNSEAANKAKQESATQANEIVVDENGNKLFSNEASNSDKQNGNKLTPTLVQPNEISGSESDIDKNEAANSNESTTNTLTDTLENGSTKTETDKSEVSSSNESNTNTLTDTLESRATKTETTEAEKNAATDEEKLPIEPMPEESVPIEPLPTEEEALEQEIIADEMAASPTPLGEMLNEVLDEKKVMDNIRAECRELSLLSNVPADQLEETIEACVVLTLDEEDPVPAGPEEEVGDIEYENIPEIINDDPEPIPEIIDDEPEVGGDNLNVNIIDEMKEGTTVEPKPIKNNANQLTKVSSKSFYELTKKACEIVSKEEKNLSDSQRQKLVEECIESNVKSNQNAE